MLLQEFLFGGQRFWWCVRIEMRAGCRQATYLQIMRRPSLESFDETEPLTSSLPCSPPPMLCVHSHNDNRRRLVAVAVAAATSVGGVCDCGRLCILAVRTSTAAHGGAPRDQLSPINEHHTIWKMEERIDTLFNS